MSLVVFEDVSLSYGKKTILDGLSLAIAQGDRIGLVGPNGSGKTTILRLTAGEQEVDHGQVRTGNDVRLGYLPQDLQLEGGRTLREFLRESIPGRTELDRQVAETEAKLRAATEAGNEETTLAVAERLAVLHERQTYYELHYTEHEALRILAGLGFETTDHDRDLTEFSGGWKMRAVLAGLLFQKPDLLLLDEPTNHLDLPSVAWFAGFLKRYSGAFVLICHDREFMNEQISRVVTFEPEGVRQYTGNYESYLKQRAEESEILENRAKNLAKQREAAEKFITRFRAKASKASAVQSRVKMLEKMDVVEVHQDRRAMRFSFPKAVRAGEEVVKVRELSKSYGDLSVFERVDLTVRRGERIGIIGKNGAGKTTLLKVIARELDATGGEVDLGHNVKVSYYAQHHAEVLDRNRTIYEEVYGHSKDAGVTRVRTLLGAFLFSGDDVDKYIKVLSGGERARVALAKMLVDPGNVILMDEPTNHLDLDSSEALADAMGTFDGTLIFVSHNRSFVRSLATRIWDVADGKVETYPGTLDEYMESSVARLEGTPPPAPAAAEVPAPKRSRAANKERKRRQAEERKLRNQKLAPLKKTAGELEERIEKLEGEQKARSAKLEDPEVYQDNEQRMKLLTELQVAADKIEELTERWGGTLEEIERVEAALAELQDS